MSRIRVLSSKRILRARIFDVMEERAAGGGIRMERRIVRHPGASVMLARDAQGRVLLIRQYRLPIRKRLWELPAGTRDAGETPLQTARRELAEETGLRARRWRKLLQFYPSPGFCDEEMSVYLAEDLTEGEASPEPYEKITRRWFSWQEALEMIARGRIRDSKTIVTLLHVEQFGLKPERGEGKSGGRSAGKKLVDRKGKDTRGKANEAGGRRVTCYGKRTGNSLSR
jgi:ADP-ribose pyrophosphatase